MRLVLSLLPSVGPILGDSETGALPSHLVLLLSGQTCHKDQLVSAGHAGTVPGTVTLNSVQQRGGG